MWSVLKPLAGLSAIVLLWNIKRSRCRISPHTAVWGFIALTCDCRGRVCIYRSRNLHVLRRFPGHSPIDIDESCQNRVSPPRAEAFSARRKVRSSSSTPCPRRRCPSFAFSRGKCHTVLLCHSQLLGAFPDRSRRELSESRLRSPRGGLLRAVERTLAWRCPVSPAQMPILRLFTRPSPRH